MGHLNPKFKKVVSSQTRPIGACLRVVLYAMLAELLGNSRDYRRVKSAAEQHAIGNVGHQLTPHRVLESITNSVDACFVILHSIIFKPVTMVVAFHTRLSAPIVMPWQEGFVSLTLTFECLQFGGNIHGAVAVIAYI